MVLNFNFFYKIFFFLTLIFFSLFFFIDGYSNLKIFSKNISTKNTIINTSNISSNNEKVKNLKLENNIKALDPNLENNIFSQETNDEEVLLVVKKNDTFSKIINPFVSNKQNKQNIINVIDKEFNLKNLNIGQEIKFYISNNNNVLNRIVIPINFNTDLVVKRIDDRYVANKIELPVSNEFIAQKFSITKSLFEDGQKAKVPLAILSEAIRLYSFDIDFQRDIRKGNQLELLYETRYNEHRRTVSYGKIIYINLILEKNIIEYFIFKNSEGFFDYFNREGKNVKKALMKTPLDGAKISSNYGMRKHPILGFNKMHRGTDFAAPKGTPVYAAGNGVVDFVGRNGGYGKYIRIRHNSSYKTAYAHLNSFKKGISKGIRVNQGQIIGFVGSTGRSTGPHLHYEVIYQGKKINPMTMKLPSGKILKNKEFEKFRISSKKIYSDFLYYLYE